MKKLLKHIIKSSLCALGFEIRRKRGKSSPEDIFSRIHSTRTSMEEVLDHFVALGLSPTTVIDVGVAYGTPALYTRFSEARHLLIEPVKEFEQNLKDICDRYHAEYVLAAASASPGEIELFVTPNLVGSSIIHSGGEKREVPVITLDDVCKERNLEGPYVLKVDVEGAELYVLDGSNRILKETELVILEVSFFRFADGYPEFYEVIDYLKTRGFVAYEMFGGHNRPLDGARAQIDIAFVKEDGRFRGSRIWATPEQTRHVESAYRSRMVVKE